tara:strand:+ start:2541 stop:3287 length:747 start_codon:yes stop_codon:yes gene_type:complete
LFFISAPFGNYLKFKNAISVTGTWTFKPRPGLTKQIIKTLRYVKTDAGWSWRNKIGLRNAGLHEGLLRTSYDNVLSIAALEPLDWHKIKLAISPDRNIELNISCPNLDTHQDTTSFDGFDKFPNHMRGKWCIVKIPPTSSNKLVDKIVDAGYNTIHASNTLATDKGGLSGYILTSYTLQLIRYIKKTHPHVEVIAGGGVSKKWHAEYYLDEGADHISIGSACFTPWKVKPILSATKTVQDQTEINIIS